MKPVQIAQVAEAVSGTIAWGDPAATVDQVVIDSREAGAGCLFVPIIGERVDAHRFIPDVLEQGAACTFSSDHTVRGEKGACIYVEDTLRALQDLAAWYRGQFDLPVIGITGSVGKTTTKEMIAAVMAKKYRTLKTLGNLNSQIGLSLMMFHLEKDTEAAVFEMGISMPGEMDRLVRIARPGTAVLTNIGVSHIGNLGSRENICREKGKIVSCLTESGALYVCGNGDLRQMSEACVPAGDYRRIYYGIEPDFEFYADEIQVMEQGQSFTFHYPGGTERVELSVMGTHNINNAVAALALAIRYEIPLSEAREALREYRPIAMRGQVKKVKGAYLIDDTYNASPDSINSNLHALFDYPGEGRKIAVLADVLELGERSEELHRSIGDYILSEREKGNKLSLLIAAGNEAAYIADCVETGADDIPVIRCGGAGEATEILKEHMRPGDWILVKGSRGMHMDQVVSELTKE